MTHAAGAMRKRAAHSRAERGSALLIVFLFAAIIAIMLYEELPVAAFEAKRAKEQLLIDRGNEYAHAVKLFVRKTGTYPTSIDQLENTNNMRFLRNRYKDPLTGKDDWRLLHAGPGGQLIDSKVNPIGGSPNGTSSNSTGANSSGSGNSGSSTAAPSTASSGFGSSGWNSSSSSSTTAEVVVPPIPQRPPAIAANGAGEVAGAPEDQNPMTPLMPPGQTDNTGQTGQPANGGQTGQTGGAGQNGAQPGAGTGGSAGSGNGMDTVRNLLNNPNAPPPSPQTSSSGTGTIMSGGIAGVASKAQGHSIKTVNDQINYSLWEFYYDPSKDLTGGVASAAQAGAAQSAAQVAGQNSGTQNSPTSPYANQQPAPVSVPTTTSSNPPQQ